MIRTQTLDTISMKVPHNRLLCNIKIKREEECFQGKNRQKFIFHERFSLLNCGYYGRRTT